MKITQELQKEGLKFYEKLIAKAWKDAHFKEQLLTTPIQAIENFGGNKINLPDDKLIVVEDQSDDTKIYLNIPQKVNLDNFELSDEQLELVSGGLVVMALIGVGALLVSSFGIGVVLYGATR